MAETVQKASGDLVYEAIGLKKQYDNGKVAALRGVDFQIRQGEFVAIVGPSGCGKSTLLQLLGSLDKPSEGVLNYRGQSLPDMADPSVYRAHEIGFVFQAFHLLPTFTVSENVQIPMFEGNLSRSQRKERAQELLKSVGLDHRLNHFPSELSGGERQRVAIARGLCNKPSVVLADEPTGNLDPRTAEHVFGTLMALARHTGLAALIATHNMELAEQMDRRVTLRDGRIEDL